MFGTRVQLVTKALSLSLFFLIGSNGTLAEAEV